MQSESILKHILIETALGKGVEEYGNMGDVSMLQVSVYRLRGLFLDARIEVLTDSAENLARFCPGARPLDNRGRVLWFENTVMLGRFSRWSPTWLRTLLTSLRQRSRLHVPNLLLGILMERLKRKNRGEEAEAVRGFVRALQNADLLVMSGAGGFYDGSRAWNMEILDLLEAGTQRKIPVVMLGQGFGPLSDEMVLERAANILPSVDFITLRGGRGSSEILRSLGVLDSSIETTGDEALELAYESRAREIGRGLGICLRFAASAATNDDDVERMRPVLQEFARKHDVRLIPLPIAIQVHTRDDLAIRKLLRGFDDQSDGGKTLDSPLRVIKQAGTCRVVVTGAYHAAVFALAQGIPVVGIAKSAYFAGKLLGLEDQFGEGCQTILLSDPDWPEKLTGSIEQLWEDAERLREPLQAAARRQIELTKMSYERVKRIAERNETGVCA